MAITRFDTPAQYQAQNTYVPIPFQEMAGAAAYRQQKADLASSRIDTAEDGLAQLSAIPGAEADEAVLAEARQNILNIRDKYAGKDYSDPMIEREINKTIRSTINSPLIKDVVQSRQAWDVNEKINAELTAKGLYRNELDDDPNKVEGGYNTATSGVYGYKSSPYQDYLRPAQQYFEPLKDSLLYDSKGNPKMQNGYRLTGIDAQKIRQVARTEAANFYDTNAGKQQVRIRAASDPNLDYNTMTEPQKINLARQVLEEVGTQFMREQYIGAQQQAGGSGSGGRTFDANTWKTIQGATTPYEVADNKEITVSVKDPEDPTVKPSWLKSQWEDIKETAVGTTDPFVDPEKRAEREASRKEDKELAYVNFQAKRKQYNVPTDLSDPEAKELMNDAIESLNVRNIGYYVLGPDARNTNLANIVGSPDDHNYYLDGPEPLTLEELTKKLNLGSPDETLAAIGGAPSLKFTPEGYVEPGMFIVTVPNGNKKRSKDKYENVFIGGNKQLAGYSASAHNLQQKFVNMDDSPTYEGIDENTGKHVYSRVSATLNRNSRSFEDNLQKYESDKQLTPEELENVNWEFAKDNIDNHIKYTMGLIEDSGIIGTDFNYITGSKPKAGPMNAEDYELPMNQMQRRYQSAYQSGLIGE